MNSPLRRSTVDDALVGRDRCVFPDDASLLPEGSVVDGSGMRADVEDVADVVVIGSGAAGATAAKVFAARGLRVVLLEEGPYVRTREFVTDFFPSAAQMLRDSGTQLTFGRSNLALLQGRCVGGGTTINSAIAWRAPESVLREWSQRHGTDEALSERALRPHFDAIERDLEVRPVPETALGRNGELFEQTAARLGLQSQRIQRYESGCDASGLCITGCQHGRKKGMNVTYIPEVLSRGGKIYAWAKAERVEMRGSRAVGVRARFHRAQGRPSLHVVARHAVVVAASAVQTPGLLRRSGVANPHVGANFQAHPGLGIVGRFDRDVHMDFGATQGSNSLHFAEHEGFKLETVSLPPELVVLRAPGYGPSLVRRLAQYDRLACWAVVVKARAVGRVVNLWGRDLVAYNFERDDLRRARKGLRVLTEMMFEAGAREVWPGAHGLPPVMTSVDQARAWDDGPTNPAAVTAMASHLFGTARMGPDKRSSVVGLDFRVHDTDGLYVLDSSVFPTNLGVNPQHTIMAVARHGATLAAQRA